jgi:type VI secretion system FHA domain protein
MHTLLSARNYVKQSFNLSVTQMQAVDNNPLRLDPAIAKHKMLADTDPSYLSSEEAFQKTFDDLKAHELATLAGMRGALEAFLESFSPESLEERFESRRARKLHFPGTRPDYWEEYCLDYNARVDAAKDKFAAIFGESFESAYVEQLQLLKNERDQRR